MTTDADRIDAVLVAEDDRARQDALDVGRSFLVQAPAGSGKTELLIQRFLALLAIAGRPEAIVAMTFTRKAAGEMRSRILAALREARDDAPVEGDHERRTRELARRALARDQALGWQLVAHPARLAIVTIDAYCAGLAGQAPLTARLAGRPRFVERPAALYRRAVQAALAAAGADDAHWRRLLAHVDNDAGRLAELLVDLTARREQWLPLVQDGDATRAAVERALTADVEGELALAQGALPAGLGRELGRLAGIAADALADAPDAAPLRRIAAAGGCPPATAAALPDWRALAAWLLVGSAARVRATVNVRQGFPPAGRGPGAAGRALAKDDMLALLDSLAAVPDFVAALDTVRALPPVDCGDDAWAVAEALFAVLPQVVAHLTLVFAAERSIDFTQGTLAALDALGSSDAPQELLLRLDATVEHLLLDEFQDTSYVQLALVRALTSGWTLGDGRTLFAVGDPMQSIYRFRAAEVRLFVEAQQQRRVAGVDVVPLTLRRNFRSQAGLVDWVNAVFPAVLGERSDPWQGAVAFAPAVARHPAQPGPAATALLVADAAGEADAVVAAVRAAHADGAADVALLVRARTHLDALLPALRAAAVPIRAVELDALADRPAVRDLTALAHALLQPADRLALLSVLRAPWCGVGLADLFALAESPDWLPALARGDTLPALALTPEGEARFARFAAAFGPALRAAGRQPAVERVRGAWLALGGPATLDEPLDLAAADSFFALLARHGRAGDVDDWDAFVDDLALLRAGGETEAPAGPAVEVMTLHRAKGLQFDTVIIAGLHRRPPRGNRPLVSWRRRPQGLLIAAGRRRGGDPEPVYDYLVRLDERETAAELARLLYVGCTRARRRLHLIGVAHPATRDDDAGDAPAWKLPARGSALASLWPGLVPQLRAAARAPTQAVPMPAPVAAASPALARLPLDWAISPPAPAPGPAGAAASLPARPPFDWADATARHVGVVAHRVYAQFAREGIARWDGERLQRERDRLRAELAGEGVPADALDAAQAALDEAITGVLASGRGRWLFFPGHEAAASEWALAGVDEATGTVRHVAIDRTFVADGIRYIVDFKTGTHEGGGAEAFLDAEVERYRAQLTHYARLVRRLDPRPIRLALFHPRIDGWRAWDYAGVPEVR